MTIFITYNLRNPISVQEISKYNLICNHIDDSSTACYLNFCVTFTLYLFIYFRVIKKVILRWLITASKRHYIFYEAYPFHLVKYISDAEILILNYLKTFTSVFKFHDMKYNDFINSEISLTKVEYI